LRLKMASSGIFRRATAAMQWKQQACTLSPYTHWEDFRFSRISLCSSDDRRPFCTLNRVDGVVESHHQEYKAPFQLFLSANASRDPIGADITHSDGRNWSPEELSHNLHGLRLLTLEDDSKLELTKMLTRKLQSISIKDAYKEQVTTFKPSQMSRAISGLAGLSSRNEVVRQLLICLTTNMNETLADARYRGWFNNQHAVNMLTAVQNMDSRHQEVRELLAAINVALVTGNKVVQMTTMQYTAAMSALQNMRSNDGVEILDLLDTLSHRILDKDTKFGANEVGIVLYSMRNMTSDHKAVRQTVRLLADKLRSGKERDVPMSEEWVCRALHGLQSMTCDRCDEVSILLSALLNRMATCKHAFSAQSISIALFGLQRMSIDCAQVRLLLIHLTQKIYECDQEFSPQLLCDCMYGLRSMSSECVEVRSILRALTQKMESCSTDLWSMRSFTTILGALQYMYGSHEEVRQLLRVLHSKTGCTPTQSLDVTARDICTALLGLQQMNPCRHIEVSSVMFLLLMMLRNCKEELTGIDIANALQGLSESTGNSPVVKQLAAAITERLKTQTEAAAPTLNAEDVSRCLHGLRNMGSVADCETAKLLNGIFSCTDLRSGGPAVPTYNTNATSQYLWTGPRITRALSGFRNMNYQGSDSVIQSVIPWLDLLANRLDSCRDVLDSDDITNCLNGLSGIDNSLPEVSTSVNCILRALAIRILANTRPFQDHQLETCFGGLRSMQCPSDSLQLLVSALAIKLHACPYTLTPSTLCTAVSCLSSLPFTPQVHCRIFWIVAERVDELTKTSIWSKHPDVNIKMTIGFRQSMLSALHTFRNKDFAEVRMLQSAVERYVGSTEVGNMSRQNSNISREVINV
jgi:hypothetical protein